MRVIAGSSGGIPLTVPKNITRPTTDRVREAIFSSLGTLTVEASVLDLFAGTGSLGIECLSRGATRAVFVDESRAACAVVKKNLQKTKLEGGDVKCCPVESFLKRSRPLKPFDLIFADPPYARDEETSELLATLLNSETLPEFLSSDGIFVLETLAREPLPETPWWTVQKEKQYGDTRVSFLVRTA